MEVLSFGKCGKKLKEVGIVTDRFANEGRFIAGVPSYMKPNANCYLKLVELNKMIRCFVIACRDISTNEIFYAYYGQNYDQEAKNFIFVRNIKELKYPTSSFDDCRFLDQFT